MLALSGQSILLSGGKGGVFGSDDFVSFSDLLQGWKIVAFFERNRNGDRKENSFNGKRNNF